MGTPGRFAERPRAYTALVTDWDGLDVEEALREAAEVGVGALILGLRQINIARRDLVEQRPETAPVVDAVLDQVEALAEPFSSALGSIVSAAGCAMPGDAGERVQELGATLAVSGPELLRLSGLTKR